MAEVKSDVFCAYGKLGGRKSKSGVVDHELYYNEPYGMPVNEYNEILTFLNSPQSNPVYPDRMVGGSSR